MRHGLTVLCLLTAWAAAWADPASAPASAPAGEEWSSARLREDAGWKVSARAGGDGLRVVVREGRTWDAALREPIVLPADGGLLRLRVADLTPGAAWFVKLRGDVRGSGQARSAVLINRCRLTGEILKDLHPLQPRLAHRPPLQLQLGLEGPAGSSVRFERLDFLPPRRPASPAAPGQLSFEAIDAMPPLPSPLKIIDWRALAREYDRFVFDFSLKGQFLPLVWLDDSRINRNAPTFGLSSYVGDGRPEKGGACQEGVTCLGAVVSAALVGIDKTQGPHDYVTMCEAFFQPKVGLVLNSQRGHAGGSFWYDLWPTVVFWHLADRTPLTDRRREILRATAERCRQATHALSAGRDAPDFDHTAFDFRTLQPVDNGKWKEPDAAAGAAFVLAAAWRRFGERGYLEAAEACLKFLDRRKANPYYEVLLPWGVLAAARANAELGRSYDLHKMLGWCFGLSDCRGGWGVMVGRWGAYDCDGLLGSIDNNGGYAFAMNTFAQAGAIVPVVRYDPRYARAIGKWMLHAANSARLFYPREIPESNQCCAFWKGDARGVIAYEGLRWEHEGKSPCATGDPVVFQWGPKTDLGLYGSSYVGYLAAVVGPTDVEGVLDLDCLATDFCGPGAHPTHLLYNPHERTREVALDLPAGRWDVYDLTAHEFRCRGLQGQAKLSVRADDAVVVVLVPAGAKALRDGPRLVIEGKVVDYRAE